MNDLQQIRLPKGMQRLLILMSNHFILPDAGALLTWVEWLNYWKRKVGWGILSFEDSIQHIFKKPSEINILGILN